MASRQIARTTVAAAVEDWLEFGLSGRSEETVTTCRLLAEKRIIPDRGARRLHQLTAEDVDQWLNRKSSDLARSTLQRLLSILRRALTRQVARDRLRRNVALHCEVPHGRAGRPSKALSLAQATAVLEAVMGSEMEAYVTVSLLTGARTQELRALTWSHLDHEGDADADPPRPPSIQVWRSVREGGDTKTRRSRRTLRLPDRVVDSLRRHLDAQNAWRSEIGDAWPEHDLVFCTRGGLPLDPANVRRSFRAVVSRAALDDQAWTPRELRRSFVSLMSDAGVPLEDISRLVGHRSTSVTEAVYRKQLRPILTQGTEAMDRLFRAPDRSPDRPDERSKPDP